MTLSRDEAIAALTAPGQPFELETIDHDGVPWRVFRHAPASLREVLLGTTAHGDRDFLVYEDERTSYAAHLRLVAAAAAALTAAGVRPGDRVGIGMRNYPEWAVSFWATVSLGAVAVPLNAWWLGPELVYAITDAGCRALVLDGERLERLRPHLDELGGASLLVCRHRGDLPAGTLGWQDVRAAADDDPSLPDVAVDADDDATILYTSGTTGAPKGAVASHRNHVTNIMNTLLGGAVAAAMVGAPPPDPDAPPRQGASLQVFPFFHIGGLSGLYVSTTVGNKLVTMYKWDVDTALDLLVRERITATAMVPTLLRQLLDSPRLAELPRDALAGIAAGGAPVPPDLIRSIDAQFESKVAPANGYGLTETTSAVIVNSGAEYVAHPDSVGRPVVGADVRVVTETGEDAPAGGIGELWVRGPNVVRGYWNKPDATAAAFTDGWFHTGDLGRVDPDGLVYVVDRLKDVVIRGGENVYSAEVEAVLFTHPSVLDVAVIGLPHASYGEEVAAVVNVRDGAALTAQELQEFAARHLASFKVPSRVVVRADPLPRTPTGKVLKRDLRDEVARTLPPT